MSKPRLHIYTEFNRRAPWSSIKRTPCGLDKRKFGTVHISESHMHFFEAYTLEDVQPKDICKNCLKAVGFSPMRYNHRYSKVYYA